MLKSKKRPKTVVFAEGEDENMLKLQSHIKIAVWEHQ